MGLISKYILPKTIDLDKALQAQASVMLTTLEDLYSASKHDDASALARISRHADKARTLKTTNMKELLDVFITPYDKESIYRMITQLDWITLSVKHFRLEKEAYQIESIEQYHPIIKHLVDMARLLNQSIGLLGNKNPATIEPKIDLINDAYDEVVTHRAEFIAQLLKQQDCKYIIRHHDILTQLKDIAMRIHVCANTLEDMAIKVT